jgi:hypothetical protein
MSGNPQNGTEKKRAPNRGASLLQKIRDNGIPVCKGLSFLTEGTF